MHLFKNVSPIIKDVDLDWDLLPQTRVSKWPFPLPKTQSVSLKHEDECSFGMTAGKMRKFASMLPILRRQQIEVAAVFGSANSNHVVAACQLLLQNGIRPVPYLKQNAGKGTNQFLLSLMVDPQDWRWLDAKEWDHLDRFESIFWEECAKTGQKGFIIQEGAFQVEALRGSMQLAQDIGRNAASLGSDYTDIFIDAGTGLSAIALALRMQETGMNARLHITLMAEDEPSFRKRMETVADWYRTAGGILAADWDSAIYLQRPLFGAAFGSFNASVKEYILRYAAVGILTDAVYSAKHFATVEQRLRNAAEEMEHVLIIHSGGAQSLPGFAHKFEPV